MADLMEVGPDNRPIGPADADVLPRMSLVAALLLAGAAAPQALPVAERPRVTFDRHSLLIDGKPTLIWSSEFHPFRLPSPDLWRDILQKMKASGFNTVAIYIDWGFHSPKKGVYDFTGIRDVERVLTMARRKALRHHPRRALCECGAVARRLSGLAGEPAGQGADRRSRISGGGRRMAGPDQPDHRAPPAGARRSSSSTRSRMSWR
jgi:hypothetical protein